MNVTPKLRRKSSMSLSTRLNQKRISASPQNRFKTSTSCSAANLRELNANSETLQRSPSVISVCSDGGIECTPPHKKMVMNLDDSLEYSPKVFDTSSSPTCLLSQTLAIDSPEVGWKWNRRCSEADSKTGIDDNNSTRTPDSAYAADSSFASVGSSSTELVSNVGLRGNAAHHRFSYSRHRNNQRKIYEQELRRIEMSKAEEKLKERCAKFQQQLKTAGSQRANKTETRRGMQIYGKKENTVSDHLISLGDFDKETVSTSSFSNCKRKVKISPDKSEKVEIINDFFNDSDSDCLLLAATQEIESKMNTKTQPAFMNVKSTSTQSTASSELIPFLYANTAPAATTTPTKSVTSTTASCSSSSNKEKRSSYYMKFLEDDCPDDWFVSLDEVILEATQNKKPRTSLQRYKSMPAETVTKPKCSSSFIAGGNTECTIDSNINAYKKIELNSDGNVASFCKMKRHSSTHTLSPASFHYKSRRQL